nr:MAG TPA: portal protein [Caudoviricetes sp.]
MSEKKQTQQMLTEDEVVETLEAVKEAFNVLDFAKGYNTGAFSPMAQNTLMKNLNISSIVPDRSDIEDALKNPTNSEEKLVSYSQSYYFSSLMYKRNVEYIANLPAFDLEMTCINANPEDYKTNKYKSDYKIIAEFFDKFDYRAQFKEILWNLLMEETYYGIFRQFDTKSIIQQWPWKYAQITGKFEYGLLYDIDMNYFLQGVVDLDCYPAWLKKKYREVFSGDVNNYKPSNKLNKRTGKFGNWIQTTPEEGFWCFKFNPKHSLQVPFFSAMLPEMAIVPVMRRLQVDQSMAAARKLLVSSVPYLKEKKSSSVANQLAIDADVLGKFIGLATQGIENAVKVLALPTEDIKGVEFENTDKDTYKNFMAITSSLLSGGKVIFSTDENQNAIETQLSLNLDELLAESVYPQFEEFLNYFANKQTKKFKWKFKFVGANDQFDRARRQDEAFKYADKGIVLPNKIASSLGLNKIELERELEEANATGFTDKLMIMVNINTMSNKDNASGRPQKSDAELTDSGAKTRSNASNIEKGGRI